MPHRRRPKSSKLSPQPASSQPSSSSLPITDTTRNKLDERRLAMEEEGKRTQRIRDDEYLLISFLQSLENTIPLSLRYLLYKARQSVLKELAQNTTDWQDFVSQHTDVVQFVHTHLTGNLSRAAVETVCLTTHKWAAEDFVKDQ